MRQEKILQQCANIRGLGVDPEDRVVVISTAHGLKFTEFKSGYHAGALGFPSALANQPVAMSGDPERAIGELHRLLDAATMAP